MTAFSASAGYYPAAGYRDNLGAMVSVSGYSGHSPASWVGRGSYLVYALECNAGSVQIYANAWCVEGLSVRCLQALTLATTIRPSSIVRQ